MNLKIISDDPQRKCINQKYLTTELMKPEGQVVLEFNWFSDYDFLKISLHKFIDQNANLFLLVIFS